MNFQFGAFRIDHICLLAALWCAGCQDNAATDANSNELQVIVVRPGDSIQEALDLAASTGVRKVLVEPGTYHPERPAQAMVWFNAEHDGITLQADGDVTLTAANPELGAVESESFPAIVNHVVYFGDGVSDATVIRGFRITGANGFVTRAGPEIQPETGVGRLMKEGFFFTDGGGIKIFGRSNPTIDSVLVTDNYASPCGGGISIEQRGFNSRPVTIRNCVFRNNRARVTGSAIDLLPGSAATVENCLFVNNLGNLGVDDVSQPGLKFNSEHGSGAITVFYDSRITVSNCTFAGNWNGVDDKGRNNVYARCIFWMNNATGGISPGGRYEIDILDGRGVEDCWLNGETIDLRGTLSEDANTFGAPDPEFDEDYVPQAAAYDGVGYRPVANNDTIRSGTR